MRELTGHRVDGIEDGLSVAALGEPGPGGACHSYKISFAETPQNGICIDNVYHLNFQNGPIKTAGVNGITNESLLDILIDRMEGFQSGLFRCHYNQTALNALRVARFALLGRTKERLARNIEGTMKP